MAHTLNLLVILFLWAIISGWFIFTVHNHLTTCGCKVFFFFLPLTSSFGTRDRLLISLSEDSQRGIHVKGSALLSCFVAWVGDFWEALANSLLGVPRCVALWQVLDNIMIHFSWKVIGTRTWQVNGQNRGCWGHGLHNGAQAPVLVPPFPIQII